MTNYYTYRDDVPLLPGQTLGFTRGRGYYAHGTPTPTQATKNTTDYREPKTPPPKPAPLPGSTPTAPVDRPDPPKPAPADPPRFDPLPGTTPSAPVDRPDPTPPAATPNGTQPTPAPGQTNPAAPPQNPGPMDAPADPTAPASPGPPKPDPPRAVGPLAGLLDGSVYVASDGAWHHIPDPETFNALGYDWNAIAWYGELPGDVGEPIDRIPPNVDNSSVLTPPLNAGSLATPARPTRPRTKAGGRRTPLTASGTRISVPPPPIVAPAPPQPPASGPTKPSQTVIIPMTIRRKNVEFTIVSGKSGHVLVNVQVVDDRYSLGLTTVAVSVDGRAVKDASGPTTTTFTVDAFVGQTISVKTTKTSAKGQVMPKAQRPEEKPEPRVKPGWPPTGLDLGKVYGPGTASNKPDVKITSADVDVVSRNGLIQLK